MNDEQVTMEQRWSTDKFKNFIYKPPKQKTTSSNLMQSETVDTHDPFGFIGSDRIQKPQ